ncbi:MAG: HAMP domain-containing protein [Bdellovibrionales bacterium]|nr:HAMP domain-containing protein [Bdellovibrionales bacterium]
MSFRTDFRRKWPQLRSLRFRLMAIFVGFFGTSLIFFSSFLYLSFIKNHETEFDVALYNYAVDVGRSIDVNFLGSIRLTPKILATSEKVFPFALGESLLQLRTLDGQSLARSETLRDGSLPITRTEREELLASRTFFKTLDTETFRAFKLRSAYRVVMVVVTPPMGPEMILQVAVPMMLIEREKRGLVSFFAVSIPLILLAAAAGGWYFADKALDPFHAIVAKAREIRADQLSERVPVPTERDEIRDLAETLNALLERIEKAFRSQETFVADASHQLRTPLAILQGEFDLMRSRDRSPEEIRNFLDTGSQEVIYLSRLVHNLLVLARVDAGEGALSVTQFRLDEAVLDVISRLEKMARTRGVRLKPHFEEAFEVMGDRDLTLVLIENLVDNAIKYSAENEAVSCRLFPRGDQVVFEVSNRGQPFPEEAKPKLFERFFRANPTHGKEKVPGSGLGLAIAKRISDLQGGTLRLETDGDQTRFVYEMRRQT